MKRWAAAGASATVLVGGLVVGAPAAVAAPGDPACLQASAEFDAALASSGLTPEALTALEQSSGALTAARDQYAALLDSAGGPSLQEFEEAGGAALALAQESGDPAAVAAAEARIAELEAALTAALGTLDPAVAEQALEDATVVSEALLAELGLDEAAAGGLLALLEQAVVACEGAAGGTPVAVPAPVPAPVPPAPAEPAPVPVAPAPAEAEPVAVNPGLNMDTGAAQPQDRPGAVLTAGLLAAGIAVAVAVRVRRHGRAGA